MKFNGSRVLKYVDCLPRKVISLRLALRNIRRNAYSGARADLLKTADYVGD